MDRSTRGEDHTGVLGPRGLEKREGGVDGDLVAQLGFFDRALDVDEFRFVKNEVDALSRSNQHVVIADIAFDEPRFGGDVRTMARYKSIQDADFVVGEERPCEMAPDESGPARDQHRLGGDLDRVHTPQ